jgi:hypothetical protein
MCRRFTYEATMRRLALLALMLIPGPTLAQDKPDGSWWATPEVRACCSVADAVIADIWHVQPDGSVIATVTDGTTHTAAWANNVIGKTYHVPADKVLTIPGNPTGRALLFVHPTTYHLYCFAPGPMI